MFFAVHHLTVNTKKTEEMVFDPGHVGDHTLLLIQDANIAQVDSYKYLGVHIDNNLSWSVHVNSVCSRIQQRLHFLRRLRVFGVQRKVMLLFYRSVIESIIRYAISVWFGNLTVKWKTQIKIGRASCRERV